MAQLKDSVVSGNLRVTDTTFTDTLQTTIIKAPTSSGGTTYGPGTSGQVLKSNGTSAYWGSDSNSVTGVKGNAETNYRTGNVNLTPANIGALALTGGTVSGTTTFKTDAFGTQLTVERNAAGSMAALGFKNPSGMLGYIAANTVDGDLHHYGADTSKDYIILDTNNTSFTRSLTSGTKIGTIKIGGTSTDLYCQTNTNTDTKVKVTSNTTTKGYLIATTTSPNGTAVEGIADTGVYLGATAGSLYAAYYKTTETMKGYFLVDSSSTEYPGIYDNGSNLWIGSLASASTHHIGATYISAGHNGTAGNPTIYVSVPNTANNGADDYPVLHSGNYTDYTVTKTGSGASGSWGISITGTAAKVAIARVTKDSKVFPGQNKVVFEEYTNGTTYNLPSNHYYHIMSAQGSDTKYGTQLALGMTTTAAYYRVCNNQTWSDWKSLINTNTTYTLGTSGNTVTLTPSSGSVQSITVPYATKAASADKLSNTAAIGSSIQPVYFNANGVPVACTQDADQAHFSTVPYVRNDGVMKVGRYLDMHSTNTETTDYNVRLDAPDASSFRFTFNTPASSSIAPSTNNQTSLGTTSLKWSNVYATTFNGDLSGNASTATKATQDSDGNAINTTYLKRSGGTMTGLLTLYREGTTANNYPAGITFSLKDTTTTKTYSDAYIYAYQDHQSPTTYGVNLVVKPGGGLFIGSGESPANHYSAKGSTYSDEATYITADDTVFIQSNGNTIANRLGFYIDTSQQIIPCRADTATNNVGSIGTSSYKWASMHATTFYGALSGNAATATTATNISTTVTNGTTSSTSYGILFAASPSGSEANSARKTNNVRISLQAKAAGSEGCAELILGNSKDVSEADNESGIVSLYSAGGSYHSIKPNSVTSATTHMLPDKGGTLFNTGNLGIVTKAVVLGQLGFDRSAGGLYYSAAVDVSDLVTKIFAVSIYDFSSVGNISVQIHAQDDTHLWAIVADPSQSAQTITVNGTLNVRIFGILI